MSEEEGRGTAPPMSDGEDVPIREFEHVCDHGLAFCWAVMGTDLRHTPVVGGEHPIEACLPLFGVAPVLVARRVVLADAVAHVSHEGPGAAGAVRVGGGLQGAQVVLVDHLAEALRDRRDVLGGFLMSERVMFAIALREPSSKRTRMDQPSKPSVSPFVVPIPTVKTRTPRSAAI